MSETLYMKADMNTEVNKDSVTLGDIADFWCTNKSVVSKVKTLHLFSIPKDKVGKKGRYAFSVIKVIEIINDEYPNVEVNNIGETDFIVDYIYKDPAKKKMHDWMDVIKIICICIIVAFGSRYAIMAYNNDVGMTEIFEKTYQIYDESQNTDGHVLEIAYSIGLPLGIIVFYNHFGSKKLTSDPTPIEVEMNNYETDIDNAMIDRSSRTKKEEK